MSSSRSAFSEIVRVGLRICVLTCIGLHVQAQDYGQVDTIRVSIGRQTVQAYHDTVMILEYSPTTGNLTATGFTRIGKNALWDSVSLVREESQQPPMKGCVKVGYRAKNDEVGPDDVWILRDARTALIDTIGRPRNLGSSTIIRRVNVHPANTRKIYAQFEYKLADGFVTSTYVTNDDGRTWKEIRTPILQSDVARKQWLSFDYSYPNRLYITVDPSGRANPDAYPRTYATDDDGDTFRGIALSDVFLIAGLGIWSKTGGVTGNEYGISFYTDSIGLPPDSTGTMRRIEPPWLENVRKTLFPSYDSTKQKLRYGMYDLTNANGTIGGLAFHPESPLTFAVRFWVDTLVNGNWRTRLFVAATRDFGHTWSMVVPPLWTDSLYTQNTTAISIDPIDDAVYVSMIRSRIDSTASNPEVFIGSYTIKATPRTTSFVDECPGITDGILQIYPNPVSQGSDVIISLDRGISKGANVIVSATCSALDGRRVSAQISRSHDSRVNETPHITLHTSELAPGVYIVLVQTHYGTESKLLVVTH